MATGGEMKNGYEYGIITTNTWCDITRRKIAGPEPLRKYVSTAHRGKVCPDVSAAAGDYTQIRELMVVKDMNNDVSHFIDT